jgi:hypothetical protein
MIGFSVNRFNTKERMLSFKMYWSWSPLELNNLPAEITPMEECNALPKFNSFVWNPA